MGRNEREGAGLSLSCTGQAASEQRHLQAIAIGGSPVNTPVRKPCRNQLLVKKNNTTHVDPAHTQARTHVELHVTLPCDWRYHSEVVSCFVMQLPSLGNVIGYKDDTNCGGVQ